MLEWAGKKNDKGCTICIGKGCVVVMLLFKKCHTPCLFRFEATSVSVIYCLTKVLL